MVSCFRISLDSTHPGSGHSLFRGHPSPRPQVYRPPPRCTGRPASEWTRRTSRSGPRCFDECSRDDGILVSSTETFRPVDWSRNSRVPPRTRTSHPYRDDEKPTPLKLFGQ